eukprot:5827582-Heterocapsa_arctica.AAC.1
MAAMSCGSSVRCTAPNPHQDASTASTSASQGADRSRLASMIRQLAQRNSRTTDGHKRTQRGPATALNA